MYETPETLIVHRDDVKGQDELLPILDELNAGHHRLPWLDMKQREKFAPPREMPVLTEAVARLVQLHDAQGNAGETARSREVLAIAKRPRQGQRNDQPVYARIQ